MKPLCCFQQIFYIRNLVTKNLTTGNGCQIDCVSWKVLEALKKGWILLYSKLFSIAIKTISVHSLWAEKLLSDELQDKLMGFAIQPATRIGGNVALPQIHSNICKQNHFKEFFRSNIRRSFLQLISCNEHCQE